MSEARGVSAELALFIFNRDQGCVAPRRGGTYHDCWGRNRIEHVKGEARIGKRAEDCPCRLLTLCEGHCEPGMKAGYVWATDKINRQACRDYLATFEYGPHVEGHVPLGPLP